MRCPCLSKTCGDSIIIPGSHQAKPAESCDFAILGSVEAGLWEAQAHRTSCAIRNVASWVHSTIRTQCSFWNTAHCVLELDTTTIKKLMFEQQFHEQEGEEEEQQRLQQLQMF